MARNSHSLMPAPPPLFFQPGMVAEMLDTSAETVASLVQAGILSQTTEGITSTSLRRHLRARLPRFFSYLTVSRLLDCHLKTVHRTIREGKIPSTTICGRKRVPATALEEARA